jgi:APA family basic amino acid/polyamine antiporter
MDVGVRRHGCCGNDVFPEPSFASWGAYGRALLKTGPRLKDRLTARSHADVEVHDLRGRSGAEMRRELNWWDLAWFGVGAVIGAGIFVLTGQEAKEAAGPAVVLSYAVSGVSAMLSVFCYTEFAIEIPVAGDSLLHPSIDLHALITLKIFVSSSSFLCKIFVVRS